MRGIDCLGMLLFLPWYLLKRPRQLPRIESILVIQLDHLGDAVLSIPLLLSLKQQFPAAKLDVLASESNAGLFRELSCLDQVHVSHCNRFSRFGKQSGWIQSIFRWGWNLRGRYQLGIDVRGELPHAVLLWLAGIPLRLGWSAGGGGFLLTHSPEYLPARHEVDSRNALLATLGVCSHQPTGSIPALFPGTTSLGSRAPHQPTIILHLGSGTAAKQWPIEYWQQLGRQLLDHQGLQLGLIGSNAEIPLAEAFLSAVPSDRVQNWVGKLSLLEVIHRLYQADGFVGADSGPAHLAALCDLPSVVLFSGTNQIAQWKPMGKRVTVLSHPVACSPCHRTQCPFHDHPCMRLIDPQQVYQACRGWLLELSKRTEHELASA